MDLKRVDKLTADNTLLREQVGEGEGEGGWRVGRMCCCITGERVLVHAHWMVVVCVCCPIYLRPKVSIRRNARAGPHAPLTPPPAPAPRCALTPPVPSPPPPPPKAEELSLTITKLQRELHERDAVNADNYATIQQLRRKVQDLEKHKFVLSYKVGGRGGTRVGEERKRW